MSAPWVRLATAAGLIGGSYAVLQSDAATRAERQVADAIRQLPLTSLDPVLGVATDLGSVYGLAGMSAAMAVTGRRDVALDLFGAGAVAWVAAQAAKPLADRPRPYDEGQADRLVAQPAGSSWPSGHSAVAAAMGLAVAQHGGLAAKAGGFKLAAFVGASRIYVGVHHPADVAAGYGVGMLSHLVATTVIRWSQRFSRRTGAFGQRGSWSVRRGSRRPS